MDFFFLNSYVSEITHFLELKTLRYLRYSKSSHSELVFCVNYLQTKINGEYFLGWMSRFVFYLHYTFHVFFYTWEEIDSCSYHLFVVTVTVNPNKWHSDNTELGPLPFYLFFTQISFDHSIFIWKINYYYYYYTLLVYR